MLLLCVCIEEILIIKRWNFLLVRVVFSFCFMANYTQIFISEMESGKEKKKERKVVKYFCDVNSINGKTKIYIKGM